jgi:hypothetical protein
MKPRLPIPYQTGAKLPQSTAANVKSNGSNLPQLKTPSKDVK